MVEEKSTASRAFNLINSIILILTALGCLLPLWYIFCVSVSDKFSVNAGLVSFWPIGFNLNSYERIIGEAAFFQAFWVSFKRVVLGTSVSVVIILLTAFPLSRTNKSMPGRNLLMWLFIFCMLFNGGIIPWYITISRYGLIDSIWGLVLAGGVPIFNIILVINFFRNIPSALVEAAYVDGAGPWRIFLQIYIPLSGPVIATITLFTIVNHWNDFFQGMVLTTKQKNYPLQTYIQQLVVTIDYSNLSADQMEAMNRLNNRSLDSAKIFIAMIPVLLIYPFLQKYFVTGITLGSVKG